MTIERITRRAALRTGAGALVALGISPAAGWADDAAVLHRKIPSSGEMLPAVGLGTGRVWTTNSAEARADMGSLLKAIVDAGGSVVDTASSYEAAEDVIGGAIKADGSGHKLFVATKMEATQKEAGAAELHRSLQRLQMSRVDLVQLHNVKDPDQSLAMFRDFKAQGLCRYFGVTSTHPQEYAAMEAVVRREKPEFMEVGYSIGDRQAEEKLLPAAAEAGAAVFVAQPVGGNHNSLFALVKGKELPAFAKDIGVATWSQFFLKYVLGHPAVTVAIPGTTSAAHMQDDLAAMRGPMPDAAARKKMAAYFDSIR